MKFFKLPGILLLFVFLAITFSAFSFTAYAENLSLISDHISRWISIDATFKSTVSKATVTYLDGVLKFGNTNGLWPSIKYDLEDNIIFNLETDRIIYDFTPGINTNIVVYFLDHKQETQFVYINPAVAGALFDKANNEIIPSTASLKGELSLGELRTGDFIKGMYSGDKVSLYADSEKTIAITGIRIDIIGSNNKTVDIRTLAVATPDKTTQVYTSDSPKTSSLKSEMQTKSSKSSSMVTKKSGTTKFKTRDTVSYATTQTQNPGSFETVPADTTGLETTLKTITETETSSLSKQRVKSVNTGSGRKWVLPAVGTVILIITLMYFKKNPKEKSLED
jgi:hypothetical protein